MDLRIETETLNARATKISLHGGLDTNTTQKLDDVLNGILRGDILGLIYDLEGLEYISSAGLRTIFRSSKELEKKRGEIAIVNVQPQVKKVFDIVQSLSVRTIFSSWDEVDEFLDMMQRRVLEGEG